MKFKPLPADNRYLLGQFHHQDVRIEWLSDAFRREGIQVDFEPVLVIDETFRPAGVGATLEPPTKQATGVVKALVQPEDRDRAVAILAKLR